MRVMTSPFTLPSVPGQPRLLQLNLLVLNGPGLNASFAIEVDTPFPAATSGVNNEAPSRCPEVQQNGSDTTIPAATATTADQPPGGLAAHIKRLDYSIAQVGASGILLCDALDAMSVMPAQRVPILRPTMFWTRATLDIIINKRIEKVESALLQTVGTRAQYPCDAYQRGRGP
ncbi:hypothetical protein N7447_007880 [Penicillium robsamsonii]|uniref:uncharacterized protein n=1 Tax=Penicillium robsamsonii TaxID=1792511 RepID=UPI0025472886|nr:uncharacterized protein N7447_007880 [Penicillium robsamsonii]KAJ5817872.1 hypothetical protein N7447_007880 [Penicillium robsamsonii]